VPEVVHRADLARIPAGELLQEEIHLAEDLPVAAGPAEPVNASETLGRLVY
jgi:hypothetical protein